LRDDGLELGGVQDANQPIGIWIGQRTDQYGIDHAEDRSSGADAETERQDSGRRKGWTLAEHPHREAELLEQQLHPPDAVDATGILTNPQGIPEVPASRRLRLCHGHTLGVELVGAFGDMELDLTLDVTIDTTRAKDVDEAIPEHVSLLAQRAHWRPERRCQDRVQLVFAFADVKCDLAIDVALQPR